MTHMSNTTPTNDPKSFSFRLKHTIVQLEQETAEGIEDWTTTIARMRDLLPELEAGEIAEMLEQPSVLLSPHADNSMMDDCDDDEDETLLEQGSLLEILQRLPQPDFC